MVEGGCSAAWGWLRARGVIDNCQCEIVQSKIGEQTLSYQEYLKLPVDYRGKVTATSKFLQAALWAPDVAALPELNPQLSQLIDPRPMHLLHRRLHNAP